MDKSNKMNRIIFFFLLITFSATSQELQLIKATKQTINSGASPTSTTNYMIQIKKDKPYKWSIDSVVNVYTQKSIKFNIVKVDDPTVLSPNYKQVTKFSKNDKGMFQITFASMKSRGSGRPGSPTGIFITLPDFPQGAIIYYRVGKKKKQLVIESFEELETINAP